MLTVILGLLVIALLFKAWWAVNDYRAVLGWVMVGIILLFCMIYPFEHGFHVAKTSDVVETYGVSEIDGKYYYFIDDEWRDVLKVENKVQSDDLSVTRRKAPGSLWYWPMSVTEANIPVIYSK